MQYSCKASMTSIAKVYAGLQLRLGSVKFLLKLESVTKEALHHLTLRQCWSMQACCAVSSGIVHSAHCRAASPLDNDVLTQLVPTALLQTRIW